jgi:hypothetical protein
VQPVDETNPARKIAVIPLDAGPQPQVRLLILIKPFGIP